MKVINDWLAMLKTTRERATWQSYMYSARRFTKFLHKKDIYRFREIKSAHILEYQISLKKLGAAAIRRELAAICSLYKWARRNEFTRIVIEDVVEKPKRPPARVTYLADADVQKLIVVWRKFPKFMQGRVRCLLYLLYHMGIRIGGIHNLNIEDFDFVNEVVRVRMKGGKIKWLPLMEEIKDVVEEYVQQEQRAGGPLFLNKYRARWSISGMRKTIKRCAVYAGLNVRIYPHLFRHTWATDKLRKGMDIRYVQEGLGHDDIRSTQIYTHVNVEDLRRELKRIMGKRK